MRWQLVQCWYTSGAMSWLKVYCGVVWARAGRAALSSTRASSREEKSGVSYEGIFFYERMKCETVMLSAAESKHLANLCV